ncbi:MAG TPA: 5-(carboxyamino)imidazole ribonucleotide synthase, partial [Candidatus Dormibacteraeota bacterium]|nr:5-(carboxyamino)imidazole ribonucleotide synthase [Candidatus Dormibacteraeota bacterium]
DRALRRPGETATVGVLGGGQLGRMLGLAGIPLGIACRFWEPSASAPAGAVGEVVRAGWDDPATLAPFANGLDVATWEVESVPASTASRLAEHVPVRPGSGWLTLAGARHVEKATLTAAGLATARFVPVASRRALDQALALVGTPAILKTARFGYDGRGQRVIRGPRQVAEAWDALGLPDHDPGEPVAVVEELVEFTRELAIIAVRGEGGETAFYPLVETRQRDGQLHAALAPAPGLTAGLQADAEGKAIALLRHGDGVSASPYRGVLALELFEAGGHLLANEIAPRVHNSGHWTIEGAATSQFENHLRAVTGLPLGATGAPRPCAVVNLVGRIRDLRGLLAVPGAHVHLYGKEPREGRKVGHVTVVGGDEAERDALLARVEGLL